MLKMAERSRRKVKTSRERRRRCRLVVKTTRGGMIIEKRKTLMSPVNQATLPSTPQHFLFACPSLARVSSSSASSLLHKHKFHHACYYFFQNHLIKIFLDFKINYFIYILNSSDKNIFIFCK